MRDGLAVCVFGMEERSLRGSGYAPYHFGMFNGGPSCLCCCDCEKWRCGSVAGIRVAGRKERWASRMAGRNERVVFIVYYGPQQESILSLESSQEIRLGCFEM
jgi:hypothetical protein